jgi:hypothetical protein
MFRSLKRWNEAPEQHSFMKFSTVLYTVGMGRYMTIKILGWVFMLTNN